MAEKNMETKICKKCKEEINKKAKRCPKCGANLGMPGFVKVLIVLVVLFAMCVGCMSSCADAVDESIKETEDSYKDVNGKTSFKVGESFENKYIKVTLESVDKDYKQYSKYSEPGEGNKVVQFVFVAENIGEDTQYFDYTDFNCYADDSKMKQFYGAEGAGFDSGGELSKGKKSKVPVYCEVPKDSKEVSVNYDASWLDDVKVEFFS